MAVQIVAGIDAIWLFPTRINNLRLRRRIDELMKTFSDSPATASMEDGSTASDRSSFISALHPQPTMSLPARDKDSHNNRAPHRSSHNSKRVSFSKESNPNESDPSSAVEPEEDQPPRRVRRKRRRRTIEEDSSTPTESLLDAQLRPASEASATVLDQTKSDKRFSFSMVPSAAAIEMSFRCGGIFTPTQCEMIRELVSQDIWPQETAPTTNPHVKNEVLTSPVSTPAVVTPKMLIEEAMRETGLSRDKLIIAYGQGEEKINGQKAKFEIMDRGDRCDRCARMKRDCYRVERDDYWTGDSCTGCRDKHTPCSFCEVIE